MGTRCSIPKKADGRSYRSQLVWHNSVGYFRAAPVCNQLDTWVPNAVITRPTAIARAYLRSLTSSNGDDRRTVISTVFRGVDNRMRSGYLLRDVINKVAGIHFTSSG